MMFRACFIASGRVQGVGFRDFVCRIGTSIGLTGYAKNLPDGTVEIVAEGEAAKIEELARRVSVRMLNGIHVDKMEEKEKIEIARRQFASFGVQY
ncbi:MAG: acylphosphatase [Candidatus Micrarchaeia archaeon]